MFLAESHAAKLRSCGLAPETIAWAGLHLGSEAEVRDILGYGVGTGLVIPYDERYARVRIASFLNYQAKNEERSKHSF